jgi:hypothetical protein
LNSRTLWLLGAGLHCMAGAVRIRISPHVHDDEINADGLVAALTRRLKG